MDFFPISNRSGVAIAFAIIIAIAVRIRIIRSTS
jgi:hypothetical protein